MSVIGCEHPDDRIEWRKWPPAIGGAVRFRLQCLECLAGLGPKDTRPLDLPDGVDPSILLMAKLDLKKKRGRTGLGGRGNSKRRRFDDYFDSPEWTRKGGVRDQVLIRDGNRCRCRCGCEARATDGAHRIYPDDIFDTRASDCYAACSACNQRERTARLYSGRRVQTRRVLGG